MRLVGVQISEGGCRSLVDLLLRVGRAGDVELAARLDRAIADGVVMLGLSPAERLTLLGVLDDPPDGLADLRGALARDHAERLESNLECDFNQPPPE